MCHDRHYDWCWWLLCFKLISHCLQFFCIFTGHFMTDRCHIKKKIIIQLRGNIYIYIQLYIYIYIYIYIHTHIHNSIDGVLWIELNCTWDILYFSRVQLKKKKSFKVCPDAVYCKWNVKLSHTIHRTACLCHMLHTLAHKVGQPVVHVEISTINVIRCSRSEWQ